ncbi:MAG: GxxExxY protein [Fibrobacteria bacterium]|nr:GxxExxY protein [Fibrobacteria bacterium]
MEKSEDILSKEIIGAAIEVHKSIGPGLLESAYEKCLCREFELRNIPFQHQYVLPVEYKGVSVECGYRIDLIVDNKIIVELKAVENIEPIHKAQLLTYLRLANLKLGLLINFNVTLLKKGIMRIVNNL